MENPPGRVRRAYVGFGANLGDPANTLREAAVELARRAGPVVAASPVYRSAPVGVTEQPAFLNALAALDTALTPGELRDVLLAVEAAGEDELRSALAADPWLVDGTLRVSRIEPWQLWLDSRR
jgi:2-amino-4-hydroxy-6-hydroxymethyldihydropteridine diphosphokinase